MPNNKGFALIEMIIVLVIIGIITATVYPSLSSAYNTSSENDRVKHEYVVNKALTEYYALTGSYPNKGDDLATVLPEETGVSLNTKNYNYTCTINENNQIVSIHVDINKKSLFW